MTYTVSYDHVLDAAYAAGLDEDNIRAKYSGRGMYGEECFGITFDSIGELLTMVAALDRSGVELDFLSRAREDGMGRGAIVYFPGVTLDGAPETDDDDDEEEDD